MKTLFIAIQISLIFVVASAQDSEVRLPAEVKNKFHAEFVNASTVSWSSLTQTRAYEADFIHQGTRKLVRYSDKGTILFSETSLFPGQLPHNVDQTIENNFFGYDIEQIRKIVTNAQVIIRVRISKRSDRYEVVIDLSGKVISKRKTGKVSEEGDKHNRKHKNKKKHKHNEYINEGD